MLDFMNLTPGQQSSLTSVELALLWGNLDFVVTTQIQLDSTTVDARSTTTTDLQAGLVLGQITSTGLYKQYSPTATDGTQVAKLLLGTFVQMLDRTGTAQNQLAVAVVAGCARNASCGGLDQFSRSHLFGRIIFDDDFVGNRGSGKDVVAKTADYTVLAADNGVTFTNQGASALVTFTLPTIAKGLRYRFFSENNNGIKILSAPTDSLVVHNDAAADTAAFSTTGRNIGAAFEVIANADATKWLVFPYIWNVADDGSTTSKATITT